MRMRMRTRPKRGWSGSQRKKRLEEGEEKEGYEEEQGGKREKVEFDHGSQALHTKAPG